MSAKECAIKDIQNDLQHEGKSFLNFRSNLNAVMRKLVSHQIQAQKQITESFWQVPPRANTQLMAHCFFSKSTAKAELNDYSKFYEK